MRLLGPFPPIGARCAAPDSWSVVTFPALSLHRTERRGRGTRLHNRGCVDFFQFGVEEPPGFAEGLEAGSFFAAVGIEPQVFARRKRFDRAHVPEVEWDDVGDDAIDVLGGEGDHFAFYVDVGVDGVSAMAFVGGGADLDAPEAASGDEDVVIAVAVSPGLGDAESEGDGFLHECQFGDLSAAFGWESVALVGGGASRMGARLRLFHCLT